MHVSSAVFALTVLAAASSAFSTQVVDSRGRTVSDNTLKAKSYAESFDDHEAELLSRALDVAQLSEDDKIMIHGREVIQCPGNYSSIAEAWAECKKLLHWSRSLEEVD